MFYLVSFLTLLISMLIYMIDPAPTDLRRETDIRSAEGYVAAFLNQHQAARDYANHWLRYIWPKEYVQTWKCNPDLSGACSDGAPVGFPVTFAHDAQVIALPGDLEDFLPLTLYGRSTFTSERRTNSATEKKGLLTFSEGNVGSYMSALVCLKQDNNPASNHYQDYVLANCYTYECVDTILTNPEADGSCKGGNYLRVKFAEGVVPYVITYSYGSTIPNWWIQKDYLIKKDKDGNDVAVPSAKPLRLELWRRAISRRSHSSYNCGVLYGRQIEGNWNGWEYHKDRTYNRVVPASPHPKPEYAYCIDNGQRCMNVLPWGIQQFLEKVTPALPLEWDDMRLNDTFFCMSPLPSDPYEKIAGSTYHFDGVNASALGAPLKKGDDWHTWVPVTGAIASLDDRATCGASVNCWDTREPPTPGVLLRGKTLEMPFRYPLDDFTLNIVLEVDGGNLGTGYIFGSGPDDTQLEPGHYYGLKIVNNVSEPTLRFYRATNAYLEIKGIINRDTPQSLGRHLLTIMRRNGKMFVAWDDRYYKTNTDHSGNPIDWTAQSSTTSDPAQKFVFGPVPGITILDVRLYGSALPGKVLQKFLKLDMKRYGIHPLPEIEGLAKIPEGVLEHDH